MLNPLRPSLPMTSCTRPAPLHLSALVPRLTRAVPRWSSWSPRMAGLVLGSLLGSPRVGAARPAAPPARVALPTSDTTLPAALATITTDTGAFAPGHKDFAHYTTPALCGGAAAMARWVVMRQYPAVQDDSFGLGAAAQVARTCGARFTAANTKPEDLRLLYELELYAQQDTEAEALAQRLVPAGTAATVRDTLELGLLQLALDDGRAAVAETLWTRLDRAGGLARLDNGVLGHLWQPEYMRENPDGTLWAAHLPAVWRRRAVEQMIALEIQPARRTVQIAYNRVYNAYSVLLEAAAFQSPDSLVAVAHRAQHDLALFPRLLVHAWEGTAWKYADKDWAHVPLDTLIANVGPFWLGFAQLTGHLRAPRLTADYFYPARGQPARDTVWPVPGKVTLLCSGAKSELPYGTQGYRWDSDLQQAADIREWMRRYGPAGLVVAIVRPAAGINDWLGFGKPHTSLADGIELVQSMAPAQEAEAWRWLEQDYLKLPVAVAVQVRHSTFLPEPDGRRITTTRLPWNAFFWHSLSPDREQFSDGRYSCKSDPNQIVRAFRKGAFLLDPSDTLPQDSLNTCRPGEEPYYCAVIDRAGQLVAVVDRGLGSTTREPVDDVLHWVFQGMGGLPTPPVAPSLAAPSAGPANARPTAAAPPTSGGLDAQRPGGLSAPPLVATGPALGSSHRGSSR